MERVPNLKIVLILGSPVVSRTQAHAYVYTHLTGWYELNDVLQASKFDGKSIDQDTYFFVDTYDILVAMNHTFSFSSPDRIHFRNFVSLGGCERRYLPPWTLEELKDAFKKLNEIGCDPSHPKFCVTMQTVEDNYVLWGGIPRIVFREDGSEDFSKERLDALLSDFESKEYCPVSARRSSGRQTNGIEEWIHYLLFHFYVDSYTFELAHRDFFPASETIVKALHAMGGKRTDEELVELIMEAQHAEAARGRLL